MFCQQMYGGGGGEGCAYECGCGHFSTCTQVPQNNNSQNKYFMKKYLGQKLSLILWLAHNLITLLLYSTLSCHIVTIPPVHATVLLRIQANSLSPTTTTPQHMRAHSPYSIPDFQSLFQIFHFLTLTPLIDCRFLLTDDASVQLWEILCFVGWVLIYTLAHTLGPHEDIICPVLLLSTLLTWDRVLTEPEAKKLKWPSCLCHCRSCASMLAPFYEC